MKIRLIYNTFFLKWGQYIAITIYPFIFFRSNKEKVSTITFRHEFQHIIQVRKLGWFKFYTTYLIQLIKHGYANHPYEVEARAHEFESLTDEMSSIIQNS